MADGSDTRILGYCMAAVRGFGYYVLFFSVIVHLFVAWKWQTTEREDLIEIEYYNPPVPEALTTPQGSPHASEVEQLLLDIKASKTRSSQVPISQVNVLLDQYNSILKTWDDGDFNDGNKNTSSDQNNIDTAASSLLPKGGKAFRPTRFLTLLMKGSLSELNTEQSLNSTFLLANQEFSRLIDNKADIQWDVVHDLLVPSNISGQKAFPLKEKLSQDDLYNLTCPSQINITSLLFETTNVSSCRADLNASLYVGEGDLGTHYLVIEAILLKRNESVKDYLLIKINGTIAAALNESLHILEKELKEAQAFANETVATYANQTQNKTDAAKPTNTSGAHCVSEGDAMTLLEEGLRKLSIRGDIRAALLKQAKKLDPGSSQSLILDAVFDTEGPIPDEVPSETINLRQLIDRPLLRHARVGIDKFFDWTRLYTDKLDNYLESQRAAFARGGGASPGEILISHLIQFTGSLRLPVPAWLRTKFRVE